MRPADDELVELRLVDEPLEREARIARTASRVSELSWANESKRYLALIEGLIRAKGTGGQTARVRAAHPDPRMPSEPGITSGEAAEAEPAASYAGRP